MESRCFSKLKGPQYQKMFLSREGWGSVFNENFPGPSRVQVKFQFSSQFSYFQVQQGHDIESEVRFKVQFGHHLVSWYTLKVGDSSSQLL